MGDGPRTRAVLIASVTLVSLLLIVAPVVAILAHALAGGWAVYLGGFTSLDTRPAILITVVTALLVVPINTVFGLAATWAIAKFHFAGKRLLLAPALALGAYGLQTFRRVTLPTIRWALFYGVTLCNARVMGEFGAVSVVSVVSVVSGNIRGVTSTLPLQIELLYHDHDAVGAFAAASVLTLLAIVTSLAKLALERHGGGSLRAEAALPLGERLDRGRPARDHLLEPPTGPNRRPAKPELERKR